jgi:hypothetical protein
MVVYPLGIATAIVKEANQLIINFDSCPKKFKMVIFDEIVVVVIWLEFGWEFRVEARYKGSGR